MAIILAPTRGQATFRNLPELTSGTTPLVGNPGVPPPDSSLVSVQLECYIPVVDAGYEHVDHFEFQKAGKDGDSFGAFAPWRTKDAAEIISGTKDGVPRKWVELITQTTLGAPLLFRARVVTATAISFWSNIALGCGLYAINDQPLLTLLYWAVLPGATSYQIGRGLTRTNFSSPIATINNVLVSDYRDTGVSLGNDYSYIMRSDLALGDAFTFGPPTPPALFAAVVDATAPAAPFVTLSWQSGLGYLDSTRFELQRAEGTNAYVSLLAEGDSLSHATTSYVDRTVMPGHQYRYQIRALTVIGPHSAWSDPETIVLASGAFRQARGASFDSPGASFTTDFAEDVLDGSLLVVPVTQAYYASAPATVDVTDSQDNTYTQAGSYVTSTGGNTLRISLWYTVSSAAGPCTVTVAPSDTNTSTQGVWWGGALEYTGLGDLEDSSGNFDDGTHGTTVETGPMSFTVGGLAIALASDYGTVPNGSFEPGAGYNLRLNPTTSDGPPPTGSGLAVWDNLGKDDSTGTLELSGTFTESDVPLATPSACAGATFALVTLPKPTGVAATRENPSRVDVTWNPVLSSTGFRIFRSTDGVTYTRIDDVTEDAAFTYSDTSVSAGSYWYKVQVYDANGVSPKSDAATTD